MSSLTHFPWNYEVCVFANQIQDQAILIHVGISTPLLKKLLQGSWFGVIQGSRSLLQQERRGLNSTL